MGQMLIKYLERLRQKVGHGIRQVGRFWWFWQSSSTGVMEGEFTSRFSKKNVAMKGVDKNEKVGSGRREERDGKYCWILSDRMMKHIYILNRTHIKVSSYFR